MTRFTGPPTYEDFARSHTGAFPIHLTSDRRPFWSKGWQGCHFNCGQPTNGPVTLVPRVSYNCGLVTRGWYCR